MAQDEVDYTSLPEAALIAMAKDGDKSAFGELYDRFVERIYNYIFYRVGENQQEAEDLTAKIFHKALDHIGRFEVRGSIPFSAWLYRIAHNLVANWYRDGDRRKEVSLDVTDHVAPARSRPDHLAEVTEEREALLDAIRRLPSDRQQLIVLKFTDGLSNAQIGDIMGRSEGAIKSLYDRTVKALREDLVTRGWD